MRAFADIATRVLPQQATSVFCSFFPSCSPRNTCDPIFSVISWPMSLSLYLSVPSQPPTFMVSFSRLGPPLFAQIGETASPVVPPLDLHHYNADPHLIEPIIIFLVTPLVKWLSLRPPPSPTVLSSGSSSRTPVLPKLLICQ